MALALDHILQTTTDLDAARAALEEIGLATTEGGRHTLWGTRNALCHIGLPYVELLAVDDRRAARGSAFGRAVLAEEERGDGIWRLALRTDDIERVASGVRAAGFRCAGPEPGQRQIPDGSMLYWSLAFPEHPGEDLVPPMLIDWHEPDRTRFSRLVAEGVADATPRARIAGIAVACREPRSEAEWLRHALGLHAEEVTTRSYGKALCIDLPGGDVLLCGGREAPTAVQEALERRGERPFAVHLSTLRESVGGEATIGGARYTFAPI